MEPQKVTDYTILAGKQVTAQNTVLQKTYLLLALSFLPCVAGVVVSFLFNPLAIFNGLSPVAFGIGFLVMFYAMCFLIEKNRYSNIGVALLMALTFLMGLMLSGMLAYTLSYSNGGKLIALAAMMTTGVFFTMAALAHKTTINMNALSKFLTVGAVVLMIGVVANLFLQVSALSLTLSAGFVIFSSLIIMWQVRTIIDGGEDSHISAALTIFISIYNIFVSLLRILTVLAGED